jgi:hypothetical protein
LVRCWARFNSRITIARIAFALPFRRIVPSSDAIWHRRMRPFRNRCLRELKMRSRFRTLAATAEIYR